MSKLRDVNLKYFDTVKENYFLIRSFDNINIDKEYQFSTHPDFVSNPAKISCFLGTLKTEEEEIEVIGASQEYIVNKKKQPERILNLPKYSDNKGLFSFTHIDSDKKLKIETYNLEIHPFYEPLKVPGIIRRFLSKKYPMSAIVSTSESLNMPLGDKPDKENLTTKYYCYGFVNEKVGPRLLGFGPGKFDKAFKHYTLEDLDDSKCKLTLTVLISPRSRKVLNVMGFDPVYGCLKFIDMIFFHRLNIYEKWKANIELQMMKHHVNVHEEMLSNFFTDVTQ